MLCIDKECLARTLRVCCLSVALVMGSGCSNILEVQPLDDPQDAGRADLPQDEDAFARDDGFEPDEDRMDADSLDAEDGPDATPEDLTPVLTEGAKLVTPRYGHTTTALSDGRVIVVGGFTTSEAESARAQPVKSAEMYLPREETWKSFPFPETVEPLTNHAAVRMIDDSVVAIGEFNGEPVAIKLQVKGEELDIEPFQPLPGSGVGYQNPSLAALGDDRLLLVGTTRVQLLNNGQWQELMSQVPSRSGQVMAQLPDDRWFIFSTRQAEIFDPGDSSLKQDSQPYEGLPRVSPGIAAFDEGIVLLGGYDNTTSAPLKDAWLYTTGRGWTALNDFTGGMIAPSDADGVWGAQGVGFNARANTLMFTGGSTDLGDPCAHATPKTFTYEVNERSWRSESPEMLEARFEHTFTHLNGRNAVIIGGRRLNTETGACEATNTTEWVSLRPSR